MSHHLPPPARLIVRRTTPEILKKTTSSIFSTPTNFLLFLLLSLFILSVRVNVEISTHFITSFIDNNPVIKSLIDRDNPPPNPQLNATSFPNNKTRASEIDLPNSSTDEVTAFLICVLAFTALAASYWIMIDVFVETYSKVHGIVFQLVLNHYYKRHQSFQLTFSNGSKLGLKRLTGFIAIRWGSREVFNQLICFWISRGIEDPYSFSKFVLKSKYMSFSIMTPWDETFEKEIFVFIVSCFLLDMLLSLVFAMGVWIVMGGSRKNKTQVVKEGCYLLFLMIRPAIELKCFECIVCGAFCRVVVATTFGDFFGLAFQAFMEVYFLVAWMVYYLSVKGIDSDSSGQCFGQIELQVQAMLRDIRMMILKVDSCRYEVVVF